MKRKHLLLAIAVLLAAGGLWLARTAWRAPASDGSSTAGTASTAAGLDTQGEAGSGEILNPRVRHAPPDPARKFMEFTPEQRVEFARRGHGPGG